MIQDQFSSLPLLELTYTSNSYCPTAYQIFGRRNWKETNPLPPMHFSVLKEKKKYTVIARIKQIILQRSCEDTHSVSIIISLYNRWRRRGLVNHEQLTFLHDFNKQYIIWKMHIYLLLAMKSAHILKIWLNILERLQLACLHVFIWP